MKQHTDHLIETKNPHHYSGDSSQLAGWLSSLGAYLPLCLVFAAQASSTVLI
jgi:hypothetical protein